MKTASHRILPSEITPESRLFRPPPAAGRGPRRRCGTAARRSAARAAAAPPATGRDQRRRAIRPCRSPTRRTPTRTSPPTTTTTSSAPARTSRPCMSRNFKPTPWSVTIDGEAEVKGKFTLEDILKPHAHGRARLPAALRRGLVHGHSVGRLSAGRSAASASSPLRRRSSWNSPRCWIAKRMPGQRRPAVLRWPYVEGLRMDEAMHPLTFMAMGLYGQMLPNQNGAPLRLVAPWKYGFKNIKAIVRIRFTEKQPVNSWQDRRLPRIRLLRQRESGGGSSALEPGHRAPHRQQLAARRARRHPALQWLRRAGGLAVRGHGSAAPVLNRERAPAAQFRWIYKPLVFAACAVPAVLMTAGASWSGKLSHGRWTWARTR